MNSFMYSYRYKLLRKWIISREIAVTCKECSKKKYTGLGCRFDISSPLCNGEASQSKTVFPRSYGEVNKLL